MKTPKTIVVSDYRLADNLTGFDVIRAARNAFGDDLPTIVRRKVGGPDARLCHCCCLTY